LAVSQVQVIVIGGGAAGFFGAIATARANPLARITLLEASPQVLSKVRISGGGRCNVTHACFDPAVLVQSYPRGNKALRGAFSRFQPKDTVAWFQKHGVQLKTEADGRMFPMTDSSDTIVNCLLRAAQDNHIEILLRSPVVSVTSQDGFRVTLKSGEDIWGDRLLLATGSSPQGYRIARQLGHSIEAPVPSLFTFQIPDPVLHDLAGVSVEEVQVTLTVAKERPLKQSGALLVTHWGMSGPAILKLSAWGARLLHDHRYQAQLRVNWLPKEKPETLRQNLFQYKDLHPRRAIATQFPAPLPRRLWEYLVVRAGLDPQLRWADFSKQAANRLTAELLQSEFPVRGRGVFKDEFVTCGGIPLKEVDFKTMESRCCPGLYFAGEILDVDGVTGGFNFQNAWTTGWIAGGAIAQS
jgi:predicted Rossmann fold flavoprotein